MSPPPKVTSIKNGPTFNPPNVSTITPPSEPILQQHVTKPIRTYIQPWPLHQASGDIASTPPAPHSLAKSIPTAHFLFHSSHGNNYILVTTPTIATPSSQLVKNWKKDPEIGVAYKRAHAILTARGLRSGLQKLYNEASAALKQFLSSQEIYFLLAPSHLNHRYTAERAIRTFKFHLYRRHVQQ
jgi:hypothetical protein